MEEGHVVWLSEDYNERQNIVLEVKSGRKKRRSRPKRIYLEDVRNAAMNWEIDRKDIS